MAKFANTITSSYLTEFFTIFAFARVNAQTEINRTLQ